jgi:curved DNA-binding protein CbpA
MLFPIKQGLFQYDLTDHYAILGVPLDASSKQIRARYHEIAFRLHPDTCKAQSDTERLLANQVLSKLVNPAYEILSKDKNRAEYLLVLSQTGKNLGSDLTAIPLVSEIAQQLKKSTQNFDLQYHNFINPLVTQQFENLNTFFQISAQISELNLLYLSLKQRQNSPSQAYQSSPRQPIFAHATSSSSSPTQTRTSYNPPTEGQSQEDKATSTPLDNALKRSREQMDRGQYSQVIAELHEVLKRHPQNSTSHALIGMAYLQTEQVTMAKVHINKAFTVDPYDIFANKAKQALDKISPDKGNASAAKEKNGLFGKFFGGAK